MIWVQGLVSFAVWLVVGWLVFRHFGRGGGRRPAQRVLGPVVMLVGGIVMIGGMSAIAGSGGLADGRLTVGGWLASTVVGAVFIGFQTLGAVLVTNALGLRETPSVRDASEEQEKS